MKKIIVFLALIMLLFSVHAYAEYTAEIYIDGEQLMCDATPINADGRVLVPMRAIFECLGAQVTWDGRNKSIWCTRDKQFISLGIGSNSMGTGIFNSDNEEVWTTDITLDVPADIIHGYTYVPVRAVSEALGAYVTWDDSNKRVVISSREDENNIIYYISESDGFKLYSIKQNGTDRKKISERAVKKLKIYEGRLYYSDRNSGIIYSLQDNGTEKAISENNAEIIAFENDSLYYSEISDLNKCRIYTINTKTGEKKQVTDRYVMYPQYYRGRIYYNTDDDNYMHVIRLEDGMNSDITSVNNAYSRLYTFNCMFFGEHILFENGTKFGNITSMGLDGENIKNLTKFNAFVFKNQKEGSKILYKQPEYGQDIYSMNIDGTENTLVHKGDSTWIDIDLVAQNGNEIYYKNPLRYEIYKVNIDGTNDGYVCYADDICVGNDALYASFNGLYKGNTDGSGMTHIYMRPIRDMTLRGNFVYFRDAQSLRLCVYDAEGKGGAVTPDAAFEWVCE